MTKFADGVHSYVYSIKFSNRRGSEQVENVCALHGESVEDFAEVPVCKLPKGFPVPPRR